MTQLIFDPVLCRNGSGITTSDDDYRIFLCRLHHSVERSLGTLCKGLKLEDSGRSGMSPQS